MTSNTASSRPLVMPVDLPDQQSNQDDPDAVRPRLSLFDEVRVTVDIRLGSAELSIKDLMALQAGSVVELDRGIGEAIDVLLNDKAVARAEIVALGEQFGIRITEISASP